MKTLPVLMLPLVLGASLPATAASLMLDFGATAVASPYLTLSPGHAAGNLGGSDTSWNTISTSAVHSSLSYSGGASAEGVTLVLGQEAPASEGTISYTTAISSLNLTGTGGGTTGRKSLLGAGSIYGDDTSSTAAGRDGFFGAPGAAIGFRVDGLAAGEYIVYLMGRNTNSNDPGDRPMTFHVSTGGSAGTFEFSSASSATQANTTYSTALYSNQFNSFLEEDNYVAFKVVLGDEESLFVAVDGTGVETRGFLNMAQIVAVPEPSTMMLGLVGLVPLFRRRR